MPTRRAVVTGASSGLGYRLATRLTEQGWAVTGFARRPRSAIAGAVEFDYFQADLADPGAVAAILAELGEPLDLLVHSAVYHPGPGAPRADAIEEVFRVNATAPYHLTEKLLAKRAEGTFLSVVMVNSEVMFHADRNSAVYAASKAALRQLTAGLAESCRGQDASVATVVFGPLADERKTEEIRGIAARRNLSEAEVTRMFLQRSNPDLVIESLIDYEACVRTVRYVQELGVIANGMVCRLDGGSAGSLI